MVKLFVMEQFMWQNKAPQSHGAHGEKAEKRSQKPKAKYQKSKVKDKEKKLMVVPLGTKYL